jgi:hypothetical protein
MTSCTPSFLPGELEGVAGGDNLDHLAVDGDVGVVHDLDVGVEGAEDGVVLHEVGRLLDTAGVVDGDDLEAGLRAAVPAAEEVAACAGKRAERRRGGIGENEHPSAPARFERERGFVDARSRPARRTRARTVLRERGVRRRVRGRVARGPVGPDDVRVSAVRERRGKQTPSANLPWHG